MDRYTLGIDMSLTSTGLAACDLDTGEIATTQITSSGSKTDRLPENADRLRDLAARTIGTITSGAPELILIESALFNTRQRDSSAHRRAGLWWMIVATLDQTYPVVEVSPSALKKFATGHGTANKIHVAIAIAKAYGDHAVISKKNAGSAGDRADAAALAAVGAYRLGGTPGLPRTKYRDEVISKIHWNTNQGTIPDHHADQATT